MPDKTWKSAERTISQRYYGVKRRGADTSTDNSGKATGRQGKSDIPFPGGSIEVKHGKKISYALLWSAVDQAINNKLDPCEIAVAHIHLEGKDYDDTWTGIPIEDWDRLISQPRFGIVSLRYTMILPRKKKFYNKDIERAMDQFVGKDLGDGIIPVAVFDGAVPPVIVIQRLKQFYDWFLKDNSYLISC